MNELLANRLDQMLADPVRATRLRTEAELRVAAATLAHSAANDISATTAVGVLGADDVAAFRTLVQEISDEFDLSAAVRVHVGSYSVRFSRQPVLAVPASARASY